jgi:hypothetical protein
MSNSLDLEINVLSDVKGSLENNIEKISIQVIEDTKQLEGAQTPCGQISTFISNIIDNLNKSETVEDRCNQAISALIQINKFTNEYLSNEKHKLSKKMGMIEGYQVYSQTIDEHISEKKTMKKASERIQKKVEEGIDLNKRSVGERPERLRDVRNFSNQIE